MAGISDGLGMADPPPQAAETMASSAPSERVQIRRRLLGHTGQAARSLPHQGGADPQRRQDLVPVVGVLLGEGPDEAEAAGDHHVPVGHGEVGVERAAAQFAALRPGDGQEGATRSPFDPFGKLRAGRLRVSGFIGVVDAVALAAEHVLVGQGAGDEALGEVDKLVGGELAGVVFVQRLDAGAAEVEGEGVHVAEVRWAETWGS